MPRPATSTADGQRWVYRTEGGRKCWFQAAEGTATVKQVRDRVRAAKARVAAAERETARRKPKAVMDARAEMRSAPAETPEPTRPAPEFKVVDVASVRAPGAAAFVPAAPVAMANHAADQLPLGHQAPRRLDEETLLAAAPAPGDAVAVSVPPAAAVAPQVAEAADDRPGWTATWLGVLLMALGLAVVLGSSRTVREAVLLRD